MQNFIDQFTHCGTLFAKDHNHFFIGYGKRRWSQTPSTLSPSWYFPDFFLSNETPWFTHQYWEIVAKEDLQKRLPNSGRASSLHWTCSQMPLFETSFHELKQAFTAKKLYKAVPYLFQTSSRIPNAELILQMLTSSLLYTSNTSLSNYGFWDEQEGLLGATPEILFSLDGCNFSTMACAGTLYSGQKTSLDDEKKLMKEHRFVVEGIADAIGDFGSSILIGNTDWHAFQHLKHLLTPIHMSLNPGIDFLDLVHALHPTAAIGTYPKREGQEWLQNLDALIPRNRFGAPCACAFQKKTLCLVAIRNVQWDQNEMRIGAGSGIIQESDLEMEKQEIEMKINTIKKMLKL